MFLDVHLKIVDGFFAIYLARTFNEVHTIKKSRAIVLITNFSNPESYSEANSFMHNYGKYFFLHCTDISETCPKF